MSLAPVPGPLSIATGTVIVEVLVGWSPALPRRFLPEAAGVRADFLHIKRKKDIPTTENTYKQYKQAKISNG